jgi:hypothetical protein
MALVRWLLDAAGFAGIAAVDAKRHEETGEHVSMEVHVRIPQSWAVGDAWGTDASWRLYATLAGAPLSPSPARQPG